MFWLNNLKQIYQIGFFGKWHPIHEVLRKLPLKHQEPPLMTIKQQFMTVAGTINQCRRCQATSKRTKTQCGAPAMRGKQVCRTHGGLSSGPKTVEGRNRCGIAKTVNGGETRAIRAARSAKMAELRKLEKIIEKW